jgi:methionine-rich copper-binding protein CopC
MSRFILVVALALLASPPAFAHAVYEHASPAAGSEVKSAPQAVTITFSEAVEPAFSKIEVKDANGARVDDGAVHSAGNDGRDLAVGLKKLAPGRYSVIWHVTSVDTHKTEGRYDFTVVP